ncbi:MAG: ATP-dependent zinc metalloprotease FtsH [Chloroflexi bacterium]|nr:ATP-dependent zinc metalloprotease FtsH [Chloroflexota bacterium]MCI0792286.1 ATP-dependent zinc metalloprotease FtsH [Chloroflexota bacterium]MCI0866472.1 ATP-dependent zinc metalloprotease FtsH [Chloroflexota bacterium]
MGSNRWLRNGFVYLLVIIGVIVIFYTLLPSFGGRNELPLTTVIAMSKNHEIREIMVDGKNLTVIPRVNSRNGSDRMTSTIGRDTDIINLLVGSGVEIGPPGGVEVTFKGSSGLNSLLGLMLNFLPLILFGGLILFMMRQAQGSNNQTLSFGRSRARMSTHNRSSVTFDDVAGIDEAKAELQEVVEFLKYPERFTVLGARIPKGVLLVGQPGTGKTLLARAVAGEAGVPFFNISGSEFVEMFVGVGAARVRDLFSQAKRNAPCIVFVDEIDAVGRHRGAGLGGGHDEREQTLNQILVEMDGFETNTNIIVLAATNRPDILDPALLRPGRFDRRVTLDLPDIKGRIAILKVHSAGKPLAPEVTLDNLAKETPGFTGADLSNLVNEAAIMAARASKKSIFMDDFEEAVERIIAGPERKSRVISPREKEMTAYHEAGHALVAWMLPNADRVHKISIVSRGNTGGHTSLIPDEERYLWTKNQFSDMLAVTMGGRVAEQQIFDEVTTGASNDLERATKVALSMVKRYGMSEDLGPRTFGKVQELVFLGREISEERDYGDKVAEEIDEEVKALINMAYRKAEEILIAQKPRLVQLAEYLIEHETISGDNLNRLFNDEELGGDPGTPAVLPDTPSSSPTSPEPAMPQPAPTLASSTDPAPAAGDSDG